LAGCTAAPVTSSSAPTASATSSNVFAMKVGDCLNDGASADGTGTVTRVPIVKCSVSHHSEVIAGVLLTGTNSAFPGSDAVEKSADAKCNAPYEKFTGATLKTTRLDYTYYFPSAAGWKQGDRQVLCVVYDPHGPVTGTLKGKGSAYPKS
ncbi:MAG: septum formation family protein, partial [Actinomycetota bacterium]